MTDSQERERAEFVCKWLVWSGDDGITQVVPNFGREHSLTNDCWCQPHWDTKAKGLLIHECDN